MSDKSLARTLGFATAAIMALTQAPVGFVRDEGYYFTAAQSYESWLRLLLQAPLQAIRCHNRNLHSQDKPRKLVRKKRLELLRVAPLAPKASASTNSATFAPRQTGHRKAGPARDYSGAPGENGGVRVRRPSVA